MQRTWLAVGDSWTNAGWLERLTNAADLDTTNLAVGGQMTSQVLATQVPKITQRYDCASYFAGINDVLRGWDGDAYAKQLAEVASAVEDAAAVTVTFTIPRLLGASQRAVEEANAIIEASAADRGSHVVDLRPLIRGRRDLRPDGVHPKAIRQRDVAQAVADLALPGTVVPDTPTRPDQIRDDVLSAPLWEAKHAAAAAKRRLRGLRHR